MARIRIDDKYAVLHDNGAHLRAERYGEPWRDLEGDGLVLAMAQEILALRAAERKPLTDGEVAMVAATFGAYFGPEHCASLTAFARAIERAHGIAEQPEPDDAPKPEGVLRRIVAAIDSYGPGFGSGSRDFWTAIDDARKLLGLPDRYA